MGTLVQLGKLAEGTREQGLGKYMAKNLCVSGPSGKTYVHCALPPIFAYSSHVASSVRYSGLTSAEFSLQDGILCYCQSD